MNTITIACKQIKKSFGEGEARVETLKGVDFVARENETIMFMGPSGAGKTTMISIIGGILRPDSGECLVLGEPINELPEAQKTVFRGNHIGFIYQNFNLVPTLTAVENTAIPLLLNGIPHKQAFEKAEQLLLSLGLDLQRFRVPSRLSGGEQQRVAIARACIHKPKVILCDEPTSFLDLERGKKVMELLNRIKLETNCTLIVVTHDPRILDFADRIVHIDDGIMTEKTVG